MLGSLARSLPSKLVNIRAICVFVKFSQGFINIIHNCSKSESYSALIYIQDILNCILYQTYFMIFFFQIEQNLQN